ncbi:phage holin family protein [Pseudooceanicola nanhaiensis]|uniref:phage holin family protein n=1 Tax=Pseudooceanicola nanhaiensis TaxID=375761 RepID=UPI001CD27BC9|nr:phage holin family protein [Pseudooceanicola nanhaiensis]MCA0922590.1 phage holin family protein [Pseudooceanicola nanhaiensis]
MVKLALSAAAYLIANAVGLLLATALLSGFQIDPLSFIIVVVAFSIIQAVLGPLVTKMSLKHLPQLMGGVALVTVFIGLFVTDLLLEGMVIGGIANWLAATLLVWLGSLVATILIPVYVFKQLAEEKKKAA